MNNSFWKVILRGAGRVALGLGGAVLATGVFFVAPVYGMMHYGWWVGGPLLFAFFLFACWVYGSEE